MRRQDRDVEFSLQKPTNPGPSKWLANHWRYFSPHFEMDNSVYLAIISTKAASHGHATTDGR